MKLDVGRFEARNGGADGGAADEGEGEAQQVLQGTHSDATAVLAEAIGELQGEWRSLLPMGLFGACRRRTPRG